MPGWRVITMVSSRRRCLLSGDADLHFELSNDMLWPVGKYKVDLYLNAELGQTLEFEVQ